MTRQLLDMTIMTDYGQLDLVWGDGRGFEGEWDDFFAGQANGLVGGSDPNGVYVNLARRSGGSAVRLTLLDEPAAAPAAEWEDVVEVSTTIPHGATVRYQSWAFEASGELPSIPGGTYRVRVSARGRDAGHADEFAPGVVDHYLIELWPAPLADDAVLRVGSENAKYWHREVGSRRSL